MSAGTIIQGSDKGSDNRGSTVWSNFCLLRVGCKQTCHSLQHMHLVVRVEPNYTWHTQNM